MSLNRRAFLKALAAAGLLPLYTPRLAALSPAGPAVETPTLVCLFLRGGADAVNILVPYADPDYRHLRPTLALPPPGEDGGPLPLDDHLGLHPALAPLLPLYQAGELAAVSLCGLDHDSRSHFDRQQWMERGGDGVAVPGNGWLTRVLEQIGADTPVAAVGFGGRLQTALSGSTAVAVGNLKSFAIPPHWLAVLTRLYQGDGPVEQAGRTALAAVERLDPTALPAPGGGYPDSPLGRNLRQAAQLIQSGIGVRVVSIDSNGWDTHAGQNRTLAARLDDLARSLAAFRADLGERTRQTAVVVMSEFGRRVKENASGGTDHGHGGVMWILGGGVRGGRVYGDPPDLGTLYGPGDLPVTTDYRTVLAETAMAALGATDPETLFPGFRFTPIGLFDTA